MKRLTRGFTLIELMIVVAIIGILAAVALPAMGLMCPDAAGHPNESKACKEKREGVAGKVEASAQSGAMESR